MFIFWQIYEGIEITINSLILLAKFLIQHKKSYIVTVKLCQESPESFFGRQRSMQLEKTNQHCMILAIIITAFEITRYSDNLLEELLLWIIYTHKLTRNLLLAQKNQNKTNEGQIRMQVKSTKVSYKRKNNYFHSYTYIKKNINEWQFPW